MGPLFVISAATGVATAAALMCLLFKPRVYPDSAVKLRCGWLRNSQAFEYTVAVILDQVTALMCLIQVGVFLTYANLAMYQGSTTAESRDANAISTVTWICGAWLLLAVIARFCWVRTPTDASGDTSSRRQATEHDVPRIPVHGHATRKTGVRAVPLLEVGWFREAWGTANWDDFFVWSLVLSLQSTACSVGNSGLSQAFDASEWFTCAVIICGIVLITLAAGFVLQVACSSLMHAWVDGLARKSLGASADVTGDATLFVKDVGVVMGHFLPYVRKDVIQLGTMMSVVISCACITLANGFNEEDLHARANWNWGIFTVASAFPIGFVMSIGMRLHDMATTLNAQRNKQGGR